MIRELLGVINRNKDIKETMFSTLDKSFVIVNNNLYSYWDC